MLDPLLALRFDQGLCLSENHIPIVQERLIVLETHIEHGAYLVQLDHCLIQRLFGLHRMRSSDPPNNDHPLRVDPAKHYAHMDRCRYVTKRPIGWRREPARHALAAKGVRTNLHQPVRSAPTAKQQAVFNGVQERVLIKGVSKSRWRCPECLRALVSDTNGEYYCRLHGPVGADGRMIWSVGGRDRPLDATMLIDEQQDTIIEIGR